MIGSADECICTCIYKVYIREAFKALHTYSMHSYITGMQSYLMYM